MSDEQGNGGGFEDRLRAARQRQGLEATPPTGKQRPVGLQDASAIGVALRVGIELLSALVVGLAIGWALDRWLHTVPLFLVLFVVLGGAAGVANVWRAVGPMRGPPGGKG